MSKFDPTNDNQLWRQDSEGRIINKANGKAFKWNQYGAGFEVCHLFLHKNHDLAIVRSSSSRTVPRLRVAFKCLNV